MTPANNPADDFDDEQELSCSRCGSTYCDGLKNCDICGEDTECDKALCHNCQRQQEIEEEMDNPHWQPPGYW